MKYMILILAAISFNAGAYDETSPTANSPQEKLSNQTQQFKEAVGEGVEQPPSGCQCPMMRKMMGQSKSMGAGEDIKKPHSCCQCPMMRKMMGQPAIEEK